MAEKPTRAVIYARISDDREGLALGVVRQIEDCTRKTDQLGWELNQDIESVINGVTYKGVLCDNDIGASTKTRKRRPAFDNLLAGVNVGEIDGVLYYSNSRLTRRPKEFETVIELVEHTGVKLASVASGDDDLSTADGRMTARIKASVDAAEAERISERVQRQQEQRRGNGLPPPSRRAFGYASGGIDIVPEEADAIRLGAQLLIAGASLREVGRIWTERGIAPLSAESWNAITVKRAITRPRVAGLVEHRGKLVGEGEFDAILDRVTWEHVCAAVSDRSSMARARYKGREHLLAGLLYCGRCGHRVKVNALRDSRGELRPDSFVVCDKSTGHGCGGVKRNLASLESYVFSVVDARLADVRPLDPAEGTTAEAQDYNRLTAEREATEARIATLRKQYANGDIDSIDFIPTLRSMRTKVAALDAQLRDFDVSGPALSAEDVQAAWREGSFDDRREILELVVAQVVLHPIGKVGPVRAKAMVPATTEVLLH